MEHTQDGFRQLADILESGSSDLSEEDGEEEVLPQEWEDAKEKLGEFEQASQTLLAELSSLENKYEIEKRCREEAEAYAAQMNRENMKLKRISAALLPRPDHLPGVLVDLCNEDKALSKPGPDPACQCGQQIIDLQAEVSELLHEKENLATQVKELQGRVQHLQAQLEEESSEQQSLQASMKQHQQALRRVKQVSQQLTHEYREVSQQLGLEQELREQAEAFAHQMLVKQEKASRQSLILMQNVGADLQLLQALDEVAKMAGALEEAKLEHQAEVRDLEAQLAARPQLEELHELQAALTVALEKQVCLERQLLQAEERKAVLGERVTLLEEKAKPAVASPPGLCPMAPPPPPPLPPPPCPSPVDPLWTIRQRRGAHQAKQGTTNRGTDDCRAKAVAEMMARIRSGVVLRSARGDAEEQSPATSKHRSPMLEPQGLLRTMKRPARKSSRRKGSQKHRDTQLESILQRRRRIVDCPGQPQAQQQHPVAKPMGHGTPLHSGGGTTRVHSTPETELPRTPYSNLQRCTNPSKSQPGDLGKAVAKPLRQPERGEEP